MEASCLHGATQMKHSADQAINSLSLFYYENSDTIYTRICVHTHTHTHTHTQYIYIYIVKITQCIRLVFSSLINIIIIILSSLFFCACIYVSVWACAFTLVHIKWFGNKSEFFPDNLRLQQLSSKLTAL